MKWGVVHGVVQETKQNSPDTQNMNQDHNSVSVKMKQHNYSDVQIKTEEADFPEFLDVQETHFPEFPEFPEIPDYHDAQVMNHDNMAAMDKINQVYNSAEQRKNDDIPATEKISLDNHSAEQMKNDDIPATYKISQGYNSAEQMKNDDIPATDMIKQEYNSVDQIKNYDIPATDKISQGYNSAEQMISLDNNSAGQMERGEANAIMKQSKQDSPNAQNTPSSFQAMGTGVIPSHPPNIWYYNADGWLIIINICLILGILHLAHGMTMIFVTMILYIVGTIIFSIGTYRLHGWWSSREERSENDRISGIGFLNLAFFILVGYFFLEIIVIALWFSWRAISPGTVFGEVFWCILNGFMFLYLIPIMIMRRRGYTLGWFDTLGKMFKELKNCECMSMTLE